MKRRYHITFLPADSKFDYIIYDVTDRNDCFYVCVYLKTGTIYYQNLRNL